MTTELIFFFSFSLFNNIWAPLSCGTWWNLTGITSVRFPGWIKALSRFVSYCVCEYGDELVPSWCPWKNTLPCPKDVKDYHLLSRWTPQNILYGKISKRKCNYIKHFTLCKHFFATHTQFRLLIIFPIVCLKKIYMNNNLDSQHHHLCCQS